MVKESNLPDPFEGLSKSARKKMRRKLRKDSVVKDGGGFNKGSSNNDKSGTVNIIQNNNAMDNTIRKKRKTEKGSTKDGEGGSIVSIKSNSSSSSSTSSSGDSAVDYLCSRCEEPKTITKKEEEKPLSDGERLEKMSEACKTILTCIGEDPSREGLLSTPQRWAKALLFFTQGYEKKLSEVTNDAVFAENHKEMVLVRDIDIHSLCEHHMIPFTGKVHVGYIPNGRIIGLSKIARIADMYSRRLQVQERLTSQIADAIVEAVDPLGVAVVMESSHFCMIMRGVQKVGSSTVTSCVRGCFQTDPKTRAEFFSIINRSGRL